MTFNQLVNNVEQSIDLAALATQLAELRQAMAAKQDASPHAAIAIGEVAKAEIAATEKNTPKVIEHLKAAGQWTPDFAKEIGKDVVMAAIKKSMGMEWHDVQTMRNLIVNFCSCEPRRLIYTVPDSRGCSLLVSR